MLKSINLAFSSFFTPSIVKFISTLPLILGRVETQRGITLMASNIDIVIDSHRTQLGSIEWTSRKIFFNPTVFSGTLNVQPWQAVAHVTICFWLSEKLICWIFLVYFQSTFISTQSMIIFVFHIGKSSLSYFHKVWQFSSFILERVFSEARLPLKHENVFLKRSQIAKVHHNPWACS